jgi:anti-sigma factor RsiW
MKVTRNVVIDLLPLYFAGEASADTRALVDELLERDPELRSRADEMRQDLLAEKGAPASTPPPELELRSLRRTRGFLRWQRITYAWALTLSFVSLSSIISFQGGRIHLRLLLLDYPSIFVPCLALALSCWASYIALRRRA